MTPFRDMTELTQEHFDKHITKLALQADLDQLKESVESIQSTLDSHAAILEKILQSSHHNQKP